MCWCASITNALLSQIYSLQPLLTHRPIVWMKCSTIFFLVHTVPALTRKLWLAKPSGQKTACWYTALSKFNIKPLGLYSLSCKTSYRQISWSLEAARLGVIIIVALWNRRHLGSAAADVPVKFQSDWKSLNPNLAASRLHEIWNWAWHAIDRKVPDRAVLSQGIGLGGLKQ